MQRDNESSILASISAARARTEAAEAAKTDADHTSRQAKERRDRERRVLADRVVTASRNGVAQKLVAEHAGRTREWVRLTNLGAVNPDLITAAIYTSRDGSFRDWRVAAELAWTDAARTKGLEPLVLDGFEPEGNEVARVLVYDVPWLLLLDGDAVRAAPDGKHSPDLAFDPNYTHED